MSAPVIEQDAPAVDGIPEGAHAIALPVMAVEGYDTADGRYLEPGGITHRAVPLTLYAQIRTPDGGQGHDNAHIVGAITEMVRRPGPEVVSKTTGEPFPEGTFVWSGRGWMYGDVPAKPERSAFELVRDRALSGNSIDLSDVDGVLEYAEGVDSNDPEAEPVRMRMSGVIAATTLVGQPAFPDAYVELDGELMIPEGGQVITASAVSWRSSELGDDCAPCAAGVVLASDPPEVDDAPPDAKPRHTGGMVALVPADQGALAVSGGDPAEDLHLTLVYLGDDVTAWRPEERDAVHEVARHLTMGSKDGPDSVDVPAPDAPFGKPLEARVFSHAVFNPDGGPDGDKDPASVYLFGDGGEEVAYFRNVVLDGVRGALGDSTLPEQHTPFHPHVTAGYGLDVNTLDYTGPVVFDRLRVALGDDVTDYPLGGGEAIVAAGPVIYDADAFEVAEPDAPTPLTIDAYNRISGHIATWSTCHIGFPGQCVTPPRSSSGYAYFHTGLVHTTRGDLAVGQITLGEGGHADIRANAQMAAAHYDRTGHAAADVRLRDGKHGIWCSGVVRWNLTDEQKHQLAASAPSGDWRTIRGALEMVAVLQVNVPGYPVPRARVASGLTLALVAGGAPRQVQTASTVTANVGGSLHATIAQLRGEVAPVLEFVNRALAVEQHASALAALEAELAGLDVDAVHRTAEADILRVVADWEADQGKS